MPDYPPPEKRSQKRPEKKRYTYEVFRPASEMPRTSVTDPWGEPVKKRRTLTRNEQLARNHRTYAFRGQGDGYVRRPALDLLLPREVKHVIELFYGRPVQIGLIRRWANMNVGPSPTWYKLEDELQYEFYKARHIIEWLEMSELCRDHRRWGHAKKAHVIETQYGYGAIPSNFKEMPSQCDRHGKPLYQDITLAPEKVRRRFEKAAEVERRRAERLRQSKESGFLAEQTRKSKKYKHRLAEEARIKARREYLAARQSLTTEPEDASTPPVPITPSRHEDTPDD